MYGMINAIMKNMIDQGLIRGKENSMATIISTKKDYKIELERKDITDYNMLAYTAGYYYICILKIKDSMGHPLLELHLNEMQVLKIIDNINEYFSAGWQLFDMTLLSDIMTLQPGITNSICIYHSRETWVESMQDYMHILEVKEYNRFTESMLNKLRIEMSSEDMEALCNVLYFIFLIDIDENIEYTNTFRNANLQNIDSYMLEDFYNEKQHYSNE